MFSIQKVLRGLSMRTWKAMYSAAFAVAAIAVWSAAASTPAKAVACGVGGVVSYDLTITSASGAASCLGYGDGNFAGLNDNPNLTTAFPVGVPDGENFLANAGGWTYLGDLGGTNITGLGGSGPGTWSFTAAGGLDYALGFKAGTGNDSFEWAVFLLTGLAAGLTTGIWDIIGQGGLSHVGLYSHACTVNCTPDGGSGEVPLPGAVWLFGSALAGLGMLSMRRRRTKSTL
jgi:hypothetical protein